MIRIFIEISNFKPLFLVQPEEVKSRSQYVVVAVN